MRINITASAALAGFHAAGIRKEKRVTGPKCKYTLDIRVLHVLYPASLKKIKAGLETLAEFTVLGS